VDISFIRWFRVLFCAFWSPCRAEFGVMGEKGSANTTTVDVQTLLKTVLNVSQRLSSFIV